jgi:hypothetical protein
MREFAPGFKHRPEVHVNDEAAFTSDRDEY